MRRTVSMMRRAPSDGPGLGQQASCPGPWGTVGPSPCFLPVGAVAQAQWYAKCSRPRQGSGVAAMGFFIYRAAGMRGGHNGRGRPRRLWLVPGADARATTFHAAKPTPAAPTGSIPHDLRAGAIAVIVVNPSTLGADVPGGSARQRTRGRPPYSRRAGRGVVKRAAYSGRPHEQAGLVVAFVRESAEAEQDAPRIGSHDRAPAATGRWLGRLGPIRARQQRRRRRSSSTAMLDPADRTLAQEREERGETAGLTGTSPPASGARARLGQAAQGPEGQETAPRRPSRPFDVSPTRVLREDRPTQTSKGVSRPATIRRGRTVEQPAIDPRTFSN